MDRRLKLIFPLVLVIFIVLMIGFGAFFYTDNRRLANPHRMKYLKDKGYNVERYEQDGSAVMIKKHPDGRVTRQRVTKLQVDVARDPSALERHKKEQKKSWWKKLKERRKARKELRKKQAADKKKAKAEKKAAKYTRKAQKEQLKAGKAKAVAAGGSTPVVASGSTPVVTSGSTPVVSSGTTPVVASGTTTTTAPTAAPATAPTTAPSTTSTTTPSITPVATATKASSTTSTIPATTTAKASASAPATATTTKTTTKSSKAIATTKSPKAITTTKSPKAKTKSLKATTTIKSSKATTTIKSPKATTSTIPTTKSPKPTKTVSSVPGDISSCCKCCKYMKAHMSSKCKCGCNKRVATVKKAKMGYQVSCKVNMVKAKKSKVSRPSYKTHFHDRSGNKHKVHLHLVRFMKDGCLNNFISVCRHRIYKSKHNKDKSAHDVCKKMKLFNGLKGPKRIADRTHAGIKFKCWKNVPQNLAFDPKYYGCQKNILIEVPKSKFGQRHRINEKTRVIFCVKK